MERTVVWSSGVGALAACAAAASAFLGADGSEDERSRRAWRVLVALCLVEAARVFAAHRARRKQQQTMVAPIGSKRGGANSGSYKRGGGARSWRLRDAFECALFLPLCAGAYYALAVLFGAPASTMRDETLALACLLALLTAAPACLYAGAGAARSALVGPADAAKRQQQHRPPAEDLALAAFRRQVAPTLAGAWCGATAIPLDWDRPWQAWPVPCFVGALLGHAAAQLYTLAHVLRPKNAGK